MGLGRLLRLVTLIEKAGNQNSTFAKVNVVFSSILFFKKKPCRCRRPFYQQTEQECLARVETGERVRTPTFKFSFQFCFQFSFQWKLGKVSVSLFSNFLFSFLIICKLRSGAIPELEPQAVPQFRSWLWGTFVPLPRSKTQDISAFICTLASDLSCTSLSGITTSYIGKLSTARLMRAL